MRKHSQLSGTLSPVHVRPVLTARDRQRFIAFPYSLYSSSPYWTAPLRRHQSELLFSKKNPFFTHGEITPFIAEDASGQVVGRIAAIVLAVVATLFLILGAVALTFFALPKVWAKRANWLICAIILAYAIKTYIRFTSCYVGICPVKQTAMYLVLIMPVIMLLMAFVPRMDQSEKSKVKS